MCWKQIERLSNTCTYGETLECGLHRGSFSYPHTSRLLMRFNPERLAYVDGWWQVARPEVTALANRIVWSDLARLRSAAALWQSSGWVRGHELQAALFCFLFGIRRTLTGILYLILSIILRWWIVSFSLLNTKQAFMLRHLMYMNNVLYLAKHVCLLQYLSIHHWH